MNVSLKKFFSVSVLTLLLVISPVVVSADDGDHIDNDVTTQTTSSPTIEAQDDSVGRKERFEQRKAEFKTKVDAAKQARLKARCKGSQGKLNSIRGRIKGLETSRSQVYANLVDRLTKLEERLSSSNIDTTELEGQITQLQSLVSTFNTDLENYRLAIADLAEMDCVAEPVSFQASLEAARAARAKTADSAKAIRSYLKETVKPTLVELKALLPQQNDATNTEAE